MSEAGGASRQQTRPRPSRGRADRDGSAGAGRTRATAIAAWIARALSWLPSIRETSRFRLLWELWIGILVLVTCFLIPFQLAFQHAASIRGSWLVYLIDLFFLVDLALNFNTSFRSAGVEVHDRTRTARRYLTTRFPVDLAANLPLDALLLGLAAPGASAVSAVLLLRLPRLLRVARLFAILRRWQAQSWTNSGYLRIVKFLVVAALAMHWIGCGWFLVAYLDGFPENSWVALQGLPGADPGTQYLRSLYWAIVTMTTVGYGDITPHRDIEYAFTIAVMLAGAGLYAFIIGNLASLFSSLDAAKASFWNRTEALVQYLRARAVPRPLNEQVHNYYEYVWERHRGLNADALLGDLPGPLRLEVLLHLTRDLLVKVPLFHHCSPALRNVLLLALHAQTYTPGSYIVREGEVGHEIFFISRGSVSILSKMGHESHGTLEEGDYFGDLSLLLGERRTASVKALTYCEVFVLQQHRFDAIREEYPEFRQVLQRMSSERSEKLSALVLEGVVL